jgi:hypothetical protein
MVYYAGHDVNIYFLRVLLGLSVRARPGRLSAHRVVRSKSVSCGACLWAGRALKQRKPAVSGRPEQWLTESWNPNQSPPGGLLIRGP